MDDHTTSNHKGQEEVEGIHTLYGECGDEVSTSAVSSTMLLVVLGP